MSHFILQSDALDPSRRVAEFEAICTQICHLQIVPAEKEFASRTSIALVGDLVLADTAHSACITRRSLALAAETGDNLLLHIPFYGGFSIQQRGGAEEELQAGGIYLDPTEEPGVARFHGPSTRGLYISLPREMIGAQAALPMRQRIALTPQWQLLICYARSVHAQAAALSAPELELCARHLRDLVALALGAERDAMMTAQLGAVPAARLQAIKADIDSNLGNPDLSPGWIAGRHQISTRYLRALFADIQTSFSDYVALRRLERVRAMLEDPACFARPISQIAEDAGFGDLSAFNLRFRQSFGMTPSALRNQAGLAAWGECRLTLIGCRLARDARERAMLA